MCLVKKFFCCFKLETGALIIGWLGIIGNIFAMVSVVAYTLLYSSFFKLGTVVVLIFFALFGLTYICYLLAISARNRDHTCVGPFLVVFPMVRILAMAVYIYLLGLPGIISAVFDTIVTVYVFICLYSLYVKFWEETQGFSKIKPMILQQDA